VIWRSIQFDALDLSLLFFVALYLVWGFYALFQYRQEKLAHLAAPIVLDAILVKRSSLGYVIQAVLFTAAWIFLVIAIMQPKGNARYGADYSEKMGRQSSGSRSQMQEVIFLIDASASMGVTDAYRGQTRLNYAKDLAEEIISLMRGQNISLYAFTSGLVQIVPSTTDYIFTRLMLRQLAINEGDTSGTDLETAFDGIAKVESERSMETPKTLILLSDGGDTLYETAAREKKKERLLAIVKPLEDFARMDLKTLVIGIGSEHGGVVPGVVYQGRQVEAPLEATLLREISGLGQGKYFTTDQETLHRVAIEVTKAIADQGRDYSKEHSGYNEHSIGEDAVMVYDQYYQIPLGFALASLILMLAIPNSRELRRKYEG
jgi:Ca-activated chloride channel family protein